MLKKHDCNGARTTDGSVPGGPSYLTQLDSGGVAREKALAQSLIDELDVGFYKVLETPSFPWALTGVSRS